MTEQMKQELLSGIPVHIEHLPRVYVLKLMEQIRTMKDVANFYVLVKHDPECPSMERGMSACTCKECDMEITREVTA